MAVNNVKSYEDTQQVQDKRVQDAADKEKRLAELANRNKVKEERSSEIDKRIERSKQEYGSNKGRIVDIEV